MKTYDFIGIGIGPFNLSIAALAEGLDGFSSLFLERKPHFSPAPGDDGAGLPYADQLPEGSGQRRRANQPPQLPELPGTAQKVLPFPHHRAAHRVARGVCRLPVLGGG